MTYYAIALVSSGEILKVTPNLAEAAMRLTRGCCYGKDTEIEAAIKRAKDWAAWFRSKANGQLHDMPNADQQAG